MSKSEAFSAAGRFLGRTANSAAEGGRGYARGKAGNVEAEFPERVPRFDRVGDGEGVGSFQEPTRGVSFAEPKLNLESPPAMLFQTRLPFVSR